MFCWFFSLISHYSLVCNVGPLINVSFAIVLASQWSLSCSYWLNLWHVWSVGSLWWDRDGFFRSSNSLRCLKEQGCSSQVKSFYVAQAQKKTFAQTLNNACDIPLSQLLLYLFKLMKMCISKVLKTVKSPSWKNNTIQRWQTSYSYGHVQKVGSYLEISKILESYSFRRRALWICVFLPLKTYMRRILVMGSWKTQFGYLRVFTWIKDFVSSSMKPTKS